MGAWPAKPAGEAPSWGMICALANTNGFEGLPDSYGAAGFVPSCASIHPCSDSAPHPSA